MSKLFLGCGPLPIHPQHLEIVDSSWVFIDKYVQNPRIVNMDIRKLEYPDNSVEAIYCSHALEHIGLREIHSTLAEWFRVLQPKGWVIVNVPDMEWVFSQLRLASEGQSLQSSVFNTAEKLMEVVYGNQDHEGEFHKSGYTDKTLADHFKKAGFVNVKVAKLYEAHDMGCLIAKAEKPRTETNNSGVTLAIW